LSNVESTPSNENYSLILNFHNIYQKTSSPILFMFVGSIILLVTIRQFLTTEYLPIATTGTPMTLLLLTVLYTIPITLIVFSSLFGIRYLKKRKETKRGFVKVQSALVRRSYILNFELEESAGVSQKDKIFNHLSLVFPQINKIKKMRLKRGYTNIDQQSKWRITRWFIQNNKVNSFVFKKFDFAINTSTGVFVLKIVNDKILTFEDIENTVKDIRKKMTIIGLGIEDKGVIDRLIFLTKSFDENISEQELDEKMKKLKKTCLIDIIKEEEYGYSTIWIN
jgi:hypothetical protein